MYRFIKNSLVIVNNCIVLDRRNFKLLILFTLMISFFIFVSCEKDDDSVPSIIATTYIQFQNISEYPFKVWLDGEYKATVNGGSSSNPFGTVSGLRKIRIEQQSGYFEYPLNAEQTITCLEGQLYTYKFPINTTVQINVQNNSNINLAIYIDDTIKISGLGPNSSQTIEVEGWRQYTISWRLNSTIKGSRVVQVDVGRIYTLQIN